MWKRDDAVKPATPPAGAPAMSGGEAAGTMRPGEARRPLDRDTVNIGKSVVIKGELEGSEDLTIEGQVEGKIELRQNVLTIGPNGKIKAQVFAKSVVVFGEVIGNVTATERVEIRDNGSLNGDIASPRVAIADGAQFRGSIDMQRTAAPQKAAETKPEPKPAAAPAAPVAAGPPTTQR